MAEQQETEPYEIIHELTKLEIPFYVLEGALNIGDRIDYLDSICELTALSVGADRGQVSVQRLDGIHGSQARSYVIHLRIAIQRRMMYLDKYPCTNNNKTAVFSRDQIQFVAGMYARAEKLDQRNESDNSVHVERAASLERDTQLDQVKARDAILPDAHGVQNQTKHAKNAKAKLMHAEKSAADAHKLMEWYTNILSARRELSLRSDGAEPQQKKANPGPRRCWKLSCLSFCRIILPFLKPLKKASDIATSLSNAVVKFGKATPGPGSGAKPKVSDAVESIIVGEIINNANKGKPLVRQEALNVARRIREEHAAAVDESDSKDKRLTLSWLKGLIERSMANKGDFVQADLLEGLVEALTEHTENKVIRFGNSENFRWWDASTVTFLTELGLMGKDADGNNVFLFPGNVLGMDESAAQVSRRRDGEIALIGEKLAAKLRALAGGLPGGLKVKVFRACERDNDQHLSAVGMHSLLGLLTLGFVFKGKLPTEQEIAELVKNAKYEFKKHPAPDATLPEDWTPVCLASATGSVNQENIRELLERMLKQVRQYDCFNAYV